MAPLAAVALLAAVVVVVRVVVSAPPLPSTLAGAAAGDVAAGVGSDDVELHGFVLEPAAPAPAVAAVDTRGRPWRLADQAGRVVALFFGYTHCPDVCPQTLALLAAAKAALGGDADRLVVAMITVDPERDTPDVRSRYLAGFDGAFVGLDAGASLQDTADAFGARYGRDLPPDEATRAAAVAAHDAGAGAGGTGVSDADEAADGRDAAPDAAAVGDHDDGGNPSDAGDHDDAATGASSGHAAGLPGGFTPGSDAYTVAHSGVVFVVDPAGRLRAAYLPPFDPAELADDVARLAATGAPMARR